MTPGQRIEECLTALARTASDLAEEVGCTRQYMSQIISGSKGGESFFPKIASSLGVNVSWITVGAEAYRPDFIGSRPTSPVIVEMTEIISRMKAKISVLEKENAELREQALVSQQPSRRKQKP